jgi:translocation and assembly module TamA
MRIDQKKTIRRFCEHCRLSPRLRIPLLCMCLGLGSFHLSSAWAGKVRIEGLEGDMLKNAEAYVELYQRRDDEDLSARWRKKLFEDGPQEIREALQPFGYYNAGVESSLTEEEGEWEARYAVDLGPPVRVVETDIQWLGDGAEKQELVQAIPNFPLKIGDTFVHKIYEDGKAELQDLAYELGYVKLKTTEHVVRVFPEKNEAKIRLLLDTGPRYRFGKITLDQGIMDPDLLQHYVTLEEGAPFSNAELLKFQRSLIATGWFSVVEVKPDFDAAEGVEVPIDVRFTPSTRQRVEFGIGYETDVGPRGSVRWRNNRMNSRGHQASAGLQMAPVRGDANASYNIPVRDPRTDRLNFDAKFEYEYLDDTDRDTFDLEVGFLRTTLDRKNFFELFSQFKYERFGTGGEDDTTTQILSLGTIVSRTVSEETQFVRKGYRVSGDLRVASSAFVSDTGFLRGDFDAKYLYPVGSNGRLNLRGQLGGAWVEDFSKYPNSLRFFAGGDQSVRGYGYKELGPKDDEGSVVGGKNLVVGSLEYDYRVKGPWVGAAFLDAGNAFNDSPDDIYVGAGVGVRWLAPFGSVRLDVAWPVSEESGFSGYRFHLGLGGVL